MGGEEDQSTSGDDILHSTAFACFMSSLLLFFLLFFDLIGFDSVTPM